MPVLSPVCLMSVGVRVCFVTGEMVAALVVVLVGNGEGVGKNPTDNGPEFSEHERIAEKLGTKVYFADPYCSWQKGHIENTNMLYREYIPCDGHFLEHSDEEIREIQYKLNRRPRKKTVSGCHIKNFSYICRCSCILVWNLP